MDKGQFKALSSQNIGDKSHEELQQFMAALKPVMQQMVYDLSASNHYAWRSVANTMLLRREAVLPSFSQANPKVTPDIANRMYRAPLATDSLFGDSFIPLFKEVK